METLSEWVVLHKANSRKGDESIQAIADLDPVLHEMRLIKSEAEIAILRQAARVSVQGHLSAMKSVASEKFEYQVQADMENTFKQRGAPRVAFNTIVAGGDNACVL
ncbi:MAG: Xaa-Pro aminopeptidase, partial [Piscirickettsiaceae bacterium CG_4_10_14_0_2_um_filter_44_336]